jgi:hypothetical protein
MLPSAVLLVLSAVAASAQLRVDRSWRFAGPFAAGKYERAVDVLQVPANGGPPFELSAFDVNGTFPSEFVSGGRVGWQNVEAQDVLCQKNVEAQDVLCHGLSLDLHHLVRGHSAFGWAVGSLSSSSARCIHVKVSGSVVRAWVGNVSIPLHSSGLQTQFPAGRHRLALKLSSGLNFQVNVKGCPTARAELRILKLAPGDWEVGHGRWEQGPPAYDLPDLVDNRLFSDNIHLRVVNTGTTFLENVRLHVRPSSLLASSSSPLPLALAPGQRIALYTALQVHANNVSLPLLDSSCPLEIKLDVTADEDTADADPPQTSKEIVSSTTVRLRCRKLSESFLFSFLDADGSPQVPHLSLSLSLSPPLPSPAPLPLSLSDCSPQIEGQSMLHGDDKKNKPLLLSSFLPSRALSLSLSLLSLSLTHSPPRPPPRAQAPAHRRKLAEGGRGGHVSRS